MNNKKERETIQHEVLQLLRFACERFARSMFIKASASRIRILAREIEKQAIKTALEKTDDLQKQ